MNPETEKMMQLLARIEAKLDRVLAGEQPSFDPKAFSEPREWTGEPQKDKPFSGCPVPWLEAAAKMYEAFANKAGDDEKTKNGGSKKDWNLKLAKAARDWAKFNRTNLPATPSTQDSIPF